MIESTFGVAAGAASPSSPAASSAFFSLALSLSIICWHPFKVRPSGRVSSGHGIVPHLAMIWMNREFCERGSQWRWVTVRSVAAGFPHLLRLAPVLRATFASHRE